MTQPATVLLVEDNAVELEWIHNELTQSTHGQFRLVHAPDLPSGLARLDEERFDVVLLDLSLPDAMVEPSVRGIQQAAPRTPILVWNAQRNRPLARSLLRIGVQDYIAKGEEKKEVLARSLQYAIERTRALDRLARGQEGFADCLRAIPSKDSDIVLSAPVQSKPIRLPRAGDFRDNLHLLEELVEANTELHRAKQRAERLATHCPLTGLPNRYLLSDRLQHALAAARRNRSVLAVLFLDIDNFKLINDTRGHLVGDEVLRTVGRRLCASTRSTDTVARLGGDEFTMVLGSVARSVDAVRVAKKIGQNVSQPMVLDGEELFVTASIGIALYPSDGEDEDILLRRADLAMYRAKEDGPNAYRLYSEEMTRRSVERLSMESDLWRAVENDELIPHFQAIVDGETGHVVGVEALIRWSHPAKGILAPGEFISLAEETGAILPIGEWVLRAASRQNRAWQISGLAPIPVSVNLSARQLSQADFPEVLRNIIGESGMEGKYLQLEITESSFIGNVEETIERLCSIKDMGVKIWIDDFGTGFSSLSMVTRLPVDGLKVDRSFVAEITKSPKQARVVSAVLDFANKLGLGVTAEGVETRPQLEFLLEHGCPIMQGFLFDAPSPEPDFRRILAAGRIRPKERAYE